MNPCYCASGGTFKNWPGWRPISRSSQVLAERAQLAKYDASTSFVSPSRVRKGGGTFELNFAVTIEVTRSLMTSSEVFELWAPCLKASVPA